MHTHIHSYHEFTYGWRYLGTLRADRVVWCGVPPLPSKSAPGPISICLAVPSGFAFRLRRSLVALGACTFTLVSQFGFVGKADQARVAASVASGVGFIGAGVSKAS